MLSVPLYSVHTAYSGPLWQVYGSFKWALLVQNYKKVLM